jgi:hypothetical protein
MFLVCARGALQYRGICFTPSLTEYSALSVTDGVIRIFTVSLIWSGIGFLNVNRYWFFIQMSDLNWEVRVSKGEEVNKIMMKWLLLGIALTLMLTTTGCSSAVRAIKARDLAVEAKMSNSIFLDAETLTDNPTLFVRVANTSDFQDIDFAQLLRGKLEAMGYSVTRRAKDATYLVTANLLYMGEKKEGMDERAILQAGFGGAVLGASIAGLTGSSWSGAGGAGLIAGAAMAGGEALVGEIFHVDEYMGLVDLQVKEEVEGGVTGVQVANVQDGTSTSMQTTRSITAKRQEYRTRIVVKAKQTRMDRAEACNVIADRLSSQVAGMFKF